MEELAQQILDELRTQTQWLRVLALPALRATVEAAVDTPRKRAVYELTTGDHPIKEISTATGVSVGSISAYWAEWERIGIVAASGRRYVRIASLASLGLPSGAADQPSDARGKEKHQ